MLTTIKGFKSLIVGGHSRSITAKKNIAVSFFVKGLNILISIFTVPVTLKYLSADEYGIWLTMSSLLSWVMYFDIGLGSGLRNKFAEAKSNGNYHDMKVYISTSYAILLITISVLLILFFAVNPFINWADLLNTKPNLEHVLNRTMLVLFSIFSLQFIFRLLNNILIADQRSGESDALGMIGNGLSLLIIFLLAKNTQGSLLVVGAIFTGVPLFITIVVTILLFLGRYKEVRPSIKFIKLSYYKSLMTLGGQFFVIQICGLITLGTTNIIITQLFGPTEVVSYNIVFKYFSFVLIIFTVITSSMYSAFTEAYYKNDLQWIRNVVRKINFIWVLFLIGIIFMVLISKPVFRLWVGEEIKIPLSMTVLTAVYFAITTWATVYATFISGIGKIRLAYYVSIFNSIAHIPLTIYFGKLLGIEGIMITQILLTLTGLYWLPTQYKKIITKTASGLWNR